METNNNFDYKRFEALLRPLYVELINDTKKFEDKDLITFCMQWGQFFPAEKCEGIMFYGRANNDWMCYDRDVDQVFNPDNHDCAFNRDDQMIWVEQCANSYGKYNSNHSAFWRVVRKVARHFYPDNELLHICWSNLCKVAPPCKNPSDPLYYAQLSACQKIMKIEVEAFNPKHVVLLTGFGWAKDFIEYLNDGKEPVPIEVIEWSSYAVKVFKINGVFYYLTEHPQGKREDVHISALVEAIQLRKES